VLLSALSALSSPTEAEAAGVFVTVK